MSSPPVTDRRDGIIFPVVAWAVVTAGLLAAGAWSPGASGGVAHRWVRWDAAHYLDVARRGMSAHVPGDGGLVWLPGYPLAVRAVGVLVPDLAIAAVVVTAASALVAVLAFWRWMVGKGVDRPARLLAVAVLLLTPWSFLIVLAAYSEAFFLALVVVAFVAMESRRPVLAATVAAAALLVRPTGLALVLGLVVLGLERSGALVDSPARRLPRLDRRRVRAASLVPAAALAGLVAYAVASWVAWGNPLEYWTVRAAAQQSTDGSVVVDVLKLRFVWNVLHIADHPAISLHLLLAASCTIAVLAATLAVGRRFGWGYAAYTVAAVGLGWVAESNFTEAGRLAIVAFPVAALAGEWLAGRPRVAAGALTASGVLMVFFATRFVAEVGYPGW